MYNAAIISRLHGIVAVINTDLPSGDVRFAYETVTDHIYGREYLLNACGAKITRAKKILESRKCKECFYTARLVNNDGIYPEFLIYK